MPMMGKFEVLKVFTLALYGDDTGLENHSKKDLFKTGPRKQEAGIARQRKLYKERSSRW